MADDDPFDIDRARAETPGCSNVAHFNNAGAALLPQPVVEAVFDYMHEEIQNGGYETAERRSRQLEAVYESVARLLGANLEEIALHTSATTAWNAAFSALPLQEGDRILTTVNEYASNYLVFLRAQQQLGIRIELMPPSASGEVCLESLKRKTQAPTRLIALTHVPTNGGLVQPAEAVGAIARQCGAWYFLDACQSAGQLPLDVERLQCDVLTATGRKYLRGPRGTGFLYVRKSRLPDLIPPTPDLLGAVWTSPDTYHLRDDARRFETWERNHANLAGLGAAIDYALDWRVEEIETRVKDLATDLRTALAAIPGVTIYDRGTQPCGLVTFSLDHLDSEVVKKDLRRQGINVSVSHRSSTLMDMEQRGLERVVRASVHYYNSTAELERLTEAVAHLNASARPPTSPPTL